MTKTLKKKTSTKKQSRRALKKHLSGNLKKNVEEIVKRILSKKRKDNVSKDEDIKMKAEEVTEVVLKEKGYSVAQIAKSIGLATLASTIVLYGASKEGFVTNQTVADIVEKIDNVTSLYIDKAKINIDKAKFMYTAPIGIKHFLSNEYNLFNAKLNRQLYYSQFEKLFKQ